MVSSRARVAPRALAAALAASTLVAAAPAAAGSVTIKVTDLRNTQGKIRACMTRVESIFPRCIKDPASHRANVDAAEGLTIRFDNVEPGEYAIALLHDENANGKADRVLGMAPKEGYGFSRDAPVRMAPPAWKDAVFPVGERSRTMTIRMRYFL